MSDEITQELFVSNVYVGAIIGTSGATITTLQRDSNARIVVEQDKNDPRKIIITGSAETVAIASSLVQECIDSEIARLERDPVAMGLGGNPEAMEVPNGKVGVVIGRGGENIREVQARSGARVQVGKDDGTGLRSIFLSGTEAQVASALLSAAFRLCPMPRCLVTADSNGQAAHQR